MQMSLHFTKIRLACCNPSLFQLCKDYSEGQKLVMQFKQAMIALREWQYNGLTMCILQPR